MMFAQHVKKWGIFCAVIIARDLSTKVNMLLFSCFSIITMFLFLLLLFTLGGWCVGINTPLHTSMVRG